MLTQRRAVLAAAILLPPLTIARPPAALADTILQDTTRRFLRPDVQPPEAVLKLLNAQAALREMRTLAATPLDSEERFHSRNRLPTFGM